MSIKSLFISDGYEVHKDRQRLRTRSDEPFIMYAYARFWLCFLVAVVAVDPKIRKKYAFHHLHAKMLLQCCDALPDGMVFDQLLQVIVFTQIIRKDEGNDESGALAVRTKSLSIKNSKSDILNSNDIITPELTYEYSLVV